MKTKNQYSLPLDKEHIKHQTSESPAHRKYISGNAEYDLTHAVDFLCENETPVNVALEGKVVHVQDGITKNWNKSEVPPKEFMSEDEQDGNYVVLEHDKGELSIYSHLKPGNINVRQGDEVKTGDLLGYIGHTGWSIKPHLHFMVFKFTKQKPAKDFESLEINWREAK
ncbi:M23 family metallopeptidase [Nanoarchaeota archaeon]